MWSIYTPVLFHKPENAGNLHFVSQLRANSNVEQNDNSVYPRHIDQSTLPVYGYVYYIRLLEEIEADEAAVLPPRKIWITPGLSVIYEARDKFRVLAVNPPTFSLFLSNFHHRFFFESHTRLIGYHETNMSSNEKREEKKIPNYTADLVQATSILSSPIHYSRVLASGASCPIQRASLTNQPPYCNSSISTVRSRWIDCRQL